MTISLGLSKGGLSLADVLDVAFARQKVRLDVAAGQELARRREAVIRFVDRDVATGGLQQPAYGFNRGFGHNVELAVPPERRDELQTNLIRSHASGAGDPAPVEVVRATMVLRAASLARGHSGVRPAVVQHLIDFLNHNITPVVPALGSVSASGDLAPLSHIALALIGEGDVFFGGLRVAAATALRQCGLKPLTLQMKEGLALNNGVQYSNAIGILAAAEFETLFKTAVLATSLSGQAMLGKDAALRSDLHSLRPHYGSQTIARWLQGMVQGSALHEAHQSYDTDGEIQDPYNLRCAPQILGACLELLIRAKRTFGIEADSVTDNPILLQLSRSQGRPRKDDLSRFEREYVDIVSGGHFHGMPVAIDLYGLVQAVAIVARLSNMRMVRYVDGSKNKGLGSDLKWPGSLSFLSWMEKTERDLPADFVAHVRSHFGDQQALESDQAVASALMIPEYVSAGLTNLIWGAAMPTHLFSLSTDAGQEDHVSMAANVGLRLREALRHLAQILAIELMFASQALAIRAHMRCIPSRIAHKGGWHPLSAEETKLNPLGEALLAEIRKHAPIVKHDCELAAATSMLSAAVLEGRFVEIAESTGTAFDYEDSPQR